MSTERYYVMNGNEWRFIELMWLIIMRRRLEATFLAENK